MMVDFLFDSFLGGAIWLLIGILSIRMSLNWDKEKIDWSSPAQGYLSGFIGGFMAIILGILVILGQFM